MYHFIHTVAILCMQMSHQMESLISTHRAIMCDHSLDYTVMFPEKMVIRVNVRQQIHNKSLNEDEGGITEKKKIA